jgi:hypothetical protein
MDDADLHDGLPDDEGDDVRAPWNDRAWEKVDAPAPAAFGALGGWHEVVRGAAGEATLDVFAAGTELWGRGGKGAVFQSGDGAASWVQVLRDRRFAAVAVDAARGEMVALAAEAGRSVVVRGRGASFVEAAAPALPAGEILALAAYDGRLAVAHARGAFRLEEGEWRRLEGTSSPTALTYAGAGALLVAVCSEREGRAWVIEAPEGGPALIVAEVGEATASAADDGEGARIRVLGWDDAAGIVWAEGVFGRIALRPARRLT